MGDLMNSILGSTVLLSVFVGACGLFLMYIVRLLNADQNDENETNDRVVETEKKKDQSQGGKGKKKGAEARWSGRAEKQGFSHPWLLTSLKGHAGQVLDMDFSSNGKYLASCAEDRTVVLWDVKDITQKDHRSLRINIEFDHPTYVKWSPDTKAFIINKYSENTVEVYKVEKKKDGWLGAANKVLTFPKVHEQDVIGFGIACNGKFIMTCSNKTDLVIWDLKGQQLATVDTYLMSTACAKISPCGRFIVASGFAPDVKVWEVIFAKSGGEFQEVKRAFELVGHTSGVHDVAFDADSSHIATVSKDGTWKLFDVNVEYKKGEDPHLKTTGSYAPRGGATRISLSPNAEVVAISTSNSVALYSTQSGQLNFTIENIFNGDVVFLSFDALGKYLFTAGDKHIRVFHNVTGYHCAIASAKEKLKQSQTSATKERLEKLIVDSQKFLEAIENKQ